MKPDFRVLAKTSIYPQLFQVQNGRNNELLLELNEVEEEKKEVENSLVRPGQVGWVNSEGVQEGWVNEGLLQGLVDLKIADLFLAGKEVPVQAPVQVGAGAGEGEEAGAGGGGPSLYFKKIPHMGDTNSLDRCR